MVDTSQNQEGQWYIYGRAYIATRRAAITSFKAELEAYLPGIVSLQKLQASMKEKFPEDQIHPFFSRF